MRWTCTPRRPALGDRITHVYEIKNRKTGWVYVGMSSDLRKRIPLHLAMARWSPAPLYQAIRDHGWESFDLSVWASFLKRDDAARAEIQRRFDLLDQGQSLYNLDTFRWGRPAETVEAALHG